MERADAMTCIRELKVKPVRSYTFVSKILPHLTLPAWFANTLFLGVSADVVPATYKKKKTITTGPKAVDDDEKATPEDGAARPTGIGRGQRWVIVVPVSGLSNFFD